MTAAQLQDLDAGYWFRPDTATILARLRPCPRPTPTAACASETRPPPTGYSATDFEIPTLKQVLDTFPDIPINIEIKMIKTPNDDTDRRDASGSPRDAYCDDPDGVDPGRRRTREPAQRGALREPRRTSSSSLSATRCSPVPPDGRAAHTWRWRRRQRHDRVRPLPASSRTLTSPPSRCPPTSSESTCRSSCSDQRQAHCLGYAVHIWTNGDQDETDAAYQRFYDSGADGVMTSQPRAFTTWMEQPASRARPAQPLSWPIQCPTPPATDPAGPATATGAEGEEEVQEGRRRRQEVGEAAKKQSTSARSTRRRSSGSRRLDISREGVAGLELAGVVARLEPVRPLL